MDFDRASLWMTEGKKNGSINHHGVLVIWDEDHDKRVFDFIDSMGQSLRENALLVWESKACVDVLWRNVDDAHYAETSIEVISDDTEDSWTIWNYFLLEKD